jgi:tellurite methyltransferase
LIEAIRESLAPQGLFVVVQPTMRNLERHERPSARYLLHEGELRQLADGFTVLHYNEAWLADGRHDAVLVAQKVRTA